MSKQKPVYSVGRNYCQCHPETCCCNPYVVLTPERKKYQSFYELDKAGEVCDLLNEKLERSRPKTLEVVFKPVSCVYESTIKGLHYTITETATLNGHSVVVVQRYNTKSGSLATLSRAICGDYYWSDVKSVTFSSKADALDALGLVLEEEYPNVDVDIEMV